tara:strand:+ start:811 stop:1056 length:246 start_codon:yes stop_codon:yes gene_type:complete
MQIFLNSEICKNITLTITKDDLIINRKKGLTKKLKPLPSIYQVEEDYISCLDLINKRFKKKNIIFNNNENKLITVSNWLNI